MPTPSTVPAPQIPDYAGTEKQLFSDWQKTQTGVEQAYKTTEPAVTAARSDLTKAAAAPLPEAPKLQDIPQFQPRQNVQQDMSEFAGVLSFFGALASLRTREPLTSALNAAGAAMEGLHKGQLDQAKLEMAQFDKQMTSAINENKKNLDQYNAILQAHNLSIAQKQSLLSVAAAARDDAVAQATMQQHGIEGMIKLTDMMQRTSEQADFKRTQLKQNFDLRMMQIKLQEENVKLRQRMYGMGGGADAGGLTPLATQYLSAYVTLNGRMPIGITSGRGGPIAWKVMNELAEEAQTAGLTPQEWAASGPLTREKLGAYGQLYKMRNSVEAFSEMLKLNGGILKQLASKVDVSGSPYANKSILWLRQNAINDPNVSEYLAQVQIFLPEVARVLNNPALTGQLTDTAREEMSMVVSGALPPSALNQVIDRIEQDANNRQKTLDTQLDKVVKEIKNPTGALAPISGGSLEYKGYRFPSKEALDRYKAAEGATP